MVPSARLELALQKGTDFKSVVSTNFTTRAHITTLGFTCVCLYCNRNSKTTTIKIVSIVIIFTIF